MKLLADEHFPRSLVAELALAGHDVVWVRLHRPGWTDVAILEMAEKEGRLVLTLDRDFLQIALQRRQPLVAAAVIVLSVHPATVTTLRPLLSAALALKLEWAGHIAKITPESLVFFPRPRRN